MFVKEMPSRDQNKKVLKELYYGFLVIVTWGKCRS